VWAVGLFFATENTENTEEDKFGLRLRVLTLRSRHQPLQWQRLMLV